MVRRLALTVFLVAFGFVSQSQAAIIGQYSGNTSPSDLSEIDGTFNFAVYGRGGGGTGDTFGTGFGIDAYLDAAGLASNYLYLYQIVNDGTQGKTIQTATVDVYATITDTLTIAGHGFRDGQGDVGDLYLSGRNALGLDPAVHLPDDEPSLGVSGVSIVSIGDGVAPFGTAVSPYGGGATAGTFTVFFFSPFTPPLGIGERSIIVGFTSNEAPGRVGVSLIGSTADAFAAGPTTGTNGAPGVFPEPASMAIWSLGLAMVGGVGAWRRRRLKVAA